MLKIADSKGIGMNKARSLRADGRRSKEKLPDLFGKELGRVTRAKDGLPYERVDRLSHVKIREILRTSSSVLLPLSFNFIPYQ